SKAVNWKLIEQQRTSFNSMVATLAKDPDRNNTLPLDDLSECVGATVHTTSAPEDINSPNVLYLEKEGYPYILGSYVGTRYRTGKSIMEAITPYNLNPAVNHTNLNETATPAVRMRALGAEIELGLMHRDGTGPTMEQVGEYKRHYAENARRVGITPQVDIEACVYQIETHVAPGVGYHKTRHSLEGIMQSLVNSSEATGLITTILSCYPTESDFRMTPDKKVDTAVDLMLDLNNQFPQYGERLEVARQRYHCDRPYHHVEMFRLQGCHIHLDIAGRSEALGLFTFYTMLRSASAAANIATLKGGPFVNGTCDADLLCTREYLRRTTATGNYIDIPTSPSLTPGGMETYVGLLNGGRVNAVARAMLVDYDMPTPISAMHNPIGRVRPDLGSSKRICTVESTGMPANISTARMAAILTDFEFSHTLMEGYFRQHGTDLEAMYNDREMWEVLGPLSHDTYLDMQDRSDREGSDMTLTTAAGTEMSLAEFYDRKRLFMHRALADVPNIHPRDVDDVYTSLVRMLEPPSRRAAETVEQYVADPKLRSTGNWGRILRDAFEEEGGTPGDHNPEAVLRVVHRIHDALQQRYV
ncbi:MAG: hypothetical protein AAFR56_09920, partial [Chloroflexota bacterium]